MKNEAVIYSNIYSDALPNCKNKVLYCVDLAQSVIDGSARVVKEIVDNVETATRTIKNLDIAPGITFGSNNVITQSNFPTPVAIGTKTYLNVDVISGGVNTTGNIYEGILLGKGRVLTVLCNSIAEIGDLVYAEIYISSSTGTAQALVRCTTLTNSSDAIYKRWIIGRALSRIAGANQAEITAGKVLTIDSCVPEYVFP